MKSINNLTNLQLELLKTFSYDLSEDQIHEIKALLSKYFANKATSEMDKLWEEQNWSNKNMDNWADEHMRTKYK